MTNIVSVIDHLVVVAATLEQGIGYVEKKLGVEPVKGGDHIRMDTHNCVLRLGDETYLEAIATNPATDPLSRLRRFGMDGPEQKWKAQAGPYLATFVARTSDIDACAAALPEIGAGARHAARRPVLADLDPGRLRRWLPGFQHHTELRC